MTVTNCIATIPVEFAIHAGLVGAEKNELATATVDVAVTAGLDGHLDLTMPSGRSILRQALVGMLESLDKLEDDE